MGNTIGSVGIVNNSKVIINVALCIVAQYYEANKLMPTYGGQWDNVGRVYFTIVVVPWYGPSSEFGQCITVYHDYMKRIPNLARDIIQDGEADLSGIKIKGRNVTYAQATERLKMLAVWSSGHLVTGKTITFSGGPDASDVSPGSQVIDISNDFNQIEISKSDGSEDDTSMSFQPENPDEDEYLNMDDEPNE